jgi:5-methylcytosine-specific restriction endonuclease McrA
LSITLVAEVLLKHHANRDEPESPYPEYRDIIESRKRVFSDFQPVFSNPSAISEGDFRRFLEMKNNRHWTGLHRPAKHACDDMPKLRDALSYLLDESVDIADRIDSLTGSAELSIPGLNTGILTPILLVRYPDKYGVWNGKSEAAIRALRIWPQVRRGTSKGNRYRALNELFNEIGHETKLDLWTLDGLWHVVSVASQLEADASFAKLEADEREFFEGDRTEVSSYSVERSREARQSCLRRKGYDCAVCGFNFFETYGEIGLKYIHVHHVDDLALADGERKIDPETGLVPVCPNCHAMLHKGVKKSRPLAELRARLRNAT